MCFSLGRLHYWPQLFLFYFCPCCLWGSSFWTLMNSCPLQWVWVLTTGPLGNSNLTPTLASPVSMPFALWPWLLPWKCNTFPYLLDTAFSYVLWFGQENDGRSEGAKSVPRPKDLGFPLILEDCTWTGRLVQGAWETHVEQNHLS